MKPLVLVLCLLSLAAHASPAAGEKVTIVGTYNGRPVKLDRVNLGQADNKYWNVQTATTYEGTTTTEVVQMPLMTSERTQKLLRECDRFNGQNENLTVKAGTFLTCKLTSQSGRVSVWAADVPFGVVKKVVNTKESQEYYELLSFEKKP